jgi:hypothetical protein
VVCFLVSFDRSEVPTHGFEEGVMGYNGGLSNASLFIEILEFLI